MIDVIDRQHKRCAGRSAIGIAQRYRDRAGTELIRRRHDPQSAIGARPAESDILVRNEVGVGGTEE